MNFMGTIHMLFHIKKYYLEMYEEYKWHIMFATSTLCLPMILVASFDTQYDTWQFFLGGKYSPAYNFFSYAFFFQALVWTQLSTLVYGFIRYDAPDQKEYLKDKIANLPSWDGGSEKLNDPGVYFYAPMHMCFERPFVPKPPEVKNSKSKPKGKDGDVKKALNDSVVPLNVNDTIHLNETVPLSDTTQEQIVS